MKRNLIQKLIEWKNDEDRKPALITGAKGIGKTYLTLDFAKSFYEGHIYINFENNANIREYITKKSAIHQEMNFIEMICLHYEIPIELVGNLLVILDELDACPEALAIFNNFIKIENSLPIIVISSKGELYQENKDKFLHLTLFPMEFDEFLYALGQEWYAEVIKGHYQTNRRIPQIVHTELLTLFEDYLIVGGMPAAVNEYINSESTNNIAEIHSNMLNNIQMYCKHLASEGEALKMCQVIDVIPEQLMKENKKFQYRLIRKGATYAMYKEAIDHLINQQYLLRCKKTHSSIIEHEVNIIDEPTQFKLYLHDVGILNSLLHKRYVVNEKNEHMLRKTLIENYTLQALSAKAYQPEFWESNSQAKIDFVIQTEDGQIPIEAKTNDNTRSKSISVFKTQHDIPYSIKVSSRNYEFSNGIKYIPYYAVFCL